MFHAPLFSGNKFYLKPSIIFYYTQTLKPVNIIISSISKFYLFFEQKAFFVMAVSHIEASGNCV